MTRWDEIAAEFDHVRLRSFCNGRIKIGYPPAVGQVDINLTRRTRLSDHDAIGVMHSESGTVTFALPLFSDKEIHELPGGRGILYGHWLLDVDGKTEITEQPVDTPLGFVGDDQQKILLSYGCAGDVACFDANGLRWNFVGIFEGNIEKLQLRDGEIFCFGWFDWDHSLYCLQLSAETGEIIGGDSFAMTQHRDFGVKK